MPGIRMAALHFGAASSLILAAFALCEGVQGLREVVLPQVAGQLHAIFLPFGAMVLLTWVYGWLAVPIMLPAATLAVAVILGLSGLTVSVMAVLVAKLATVPLSFSVFRRIGLDARGEGRAANWRVLLAVGLLAALIGNVPRVMAGPCCDGFTLQDRMSAYVATTAADMGGLLVMLLAAMAAFRMLRQG